MEINWKDVKFGDVWKHRKNGKTCLVLREPRGNWDTVELRHESGRVTLKQVSYFVYDFGKKQDA